MNNFTTIEFQHNRISKYVSEHIQGLEAVTKQLKIQRYSNPEHKLFNVMKLRISSNWLTSFGFTKGTKIAERVIAPLKGLRIRLAKNGEKDTKITNDRGYAKKHGRETLIDVQSQRKLREAFGNAKQVHITFNQGELIIVPVFEGIEVPKTDAIRLAIQDMNNLDDVNTAIFNAIDYVKEMQAKDVVIDYSEHFDLSQEKVLLDMQLRRIGYRVSSQGTNRTTFTSAKLPEGDDGDADSLSAVSIPPLTTIKEHKQRVLQHFNIDTPYCAMAACTSGVDIKAMEMDGFNVNALLDYRPIENRDISPIPYPQKKYISKGFDVRKDSKKVERKLSWKRNGVITDKTESGAICAAANSLKPKVVFNEDIYRFCAKRTKYSFGEIKRQNIFFGSLQCDEHSLCKNNNDKARSIISLDSTLDMIFPMLKIIEERMFSIALIENVEAFANSTECALFEEKLRALGYKVETIVHNALDFNGYSSRKRAFVFATVLDVEYEQPEKVEKRTAHFWNDIIQPNLGSHAGGTNNKENSTTTEHFRNVSHTGGIKTYIAGLKLSKKCKNSLNETQKKQVVKFQRANVRTEKSAHCGTLLKSQSRQVAESLYVKVGDEYLLPDNDICKMVMGIPQNFDVSMLSKELGNEVIGQSVDFFMHRAIGKKIKKHIDDYLISIGQQVKGITKVFENIY